MSAVNNKKGFRVGASLLVGVVSFSLAVEFSRALSARNRIVIPEPGTTIVRVREVPSISSSRVRFFLNLLRAVSVIGAAGSLGFAAYIFASSSESEVADDLGTTLPEDNPFLSDEEEGFYFDREVSDDGFEVSPVPAPPASEGGESLDVREILEGLAQSRSNLFVVGGRQSGKTATTVELIRSQYQSEPPTDFFAIDTSYSSLLGLEDDPSRFVRLDPTGFQDSQVDLVRDLFALLGSKISERGQSRLHSNQSVSSEPPIYLILDNWDQIALYLDGAGCFNELAPRLYGILSRGPSENVFTIITATSLAVNQHRMPLSVRDNCFHFLVLGHGDRSDLLGSFKASAKTVLARSDDKELANSCLDGFFALYSGIRNRVGYIPLSAESGDRFFGRRRQQQVMQQLSEIQAQPCTFSLSLNSQNLFEEIEDDRVRAIVELARESPQGAITVREVQTKRLPSLNGAFAEEIKDLFRQASEMGLGDVREKERGSFVFHLSRVSP
jgi:hypothetical protein